MKYYKKPDVANLFLVDSFESDGISVQVFVLNNKRSVKRYCRDTGLSFAEALENYYKR